MEEISSTIVPVGSLALIFAVISILVFIRKASISRQDDALITNRIDIEKKERDESLEDRKRRLEQLLKK